jgi:hypothetical protein
LEAIGQGVGKPLSEIGALLWYQAEALGHQALEIGTCSDRCVSHAVLDALNPGGQRQRIQHQTAIKLGGFLRCKGRTQAGFGEAGFGFFGDHDQRSIHRQINNSLKLFDFLNLDHWNLFVFKNPMKKTTV